MISRINIWAISVAWGVGGESLLVLQTPLHVLVSSIFLLLSWRLRKTRWHHPLCKKLLCISACQVGCALPFLLTASTSHLSLSCWELSCSDPSLLTGYFSSFPLPLLCNNITSILENMQLQFGNLIMHASTFLEQLFSAAHCSLLLISGCIAQALGRMLCKLFSYYCW